MPLRGECQTLRGTGSYQNLARNQLTAVPLTGLCHLRTIRLSAHIWLVATTRCAVRSQNTSDKAFGRLFLMCHRAGKNCITQPLCLMVPNQSFESGPLNPYRSGTAVPPACPGRGPHRAGERTGGMRNLPCFAHVPSLGHCEIAAFRYRVLQVTVWRNPRSSGAPGWHSPVNGVAAHQPRARGRLMTSRAPRLGAPVTDPRRPKSNDVGHIRQFAEAGCRYPSVDSSMRKGRRERPAPQSCHRFVRGAAGFPRLYIGRGGCS